MLNDVAFEGVIVEPKICALGIKIFLFQIIAVVTIEVANRPDRLDHDLKLTCRSLQQATSSYIILLDSTQKKDGCHPLTVRELKAARGFYKLTDSRRFKENGPRAMDALS